MASMSPNVSSWIGFTTVWGFRTKLFFGTLRIATDDGVYLGPLTPCEPSVGGGGGGGGGIGAIPGIGGGGGGGGGTEGLAKCESLVI